MIGDRQQQVETQSSIDASSPSHHQQPIWLSVWVTDRGQGGFPQILTSKLKEKGNNGS